jgi:hypothetical protein
MDIKTPQIETLTFRLKIFYSFYKQFGSKNQMRKSQMNSRCLFVKMYIYRVSSKTV